MGGEEAVMTFDVHREKGLIRSYEISGLVEFRVLEMRWYVLRGGWL